MIVSFLLSTLLFGRGNAASNETSRNQLTTLSSSLDLLPRCPPCFNCLLPAFTCGQYGTCDEYDGQCKCPPGWGGIDCLIPQCDSLADGDQRKLREPNKSCDCKEGWSGINCNVCTKDESCIGFPLAGGISSADIRLPRASGSLISNELSALPAGQIEVDPANMTCYTGGETVFENHQMCDVTNRKILDMLPDRPPQVTFSCNKADKACSFQFWVAQTESFYCALDQCTSSKRPGKGINDTDVVYACDRIKCSCISNRFLCGEDGSVDISDFLTEEIKGPASFSCKSTTSLDASKSTSSCKFEEPAMNQLITDIFGDGYITLECSGGECLHYSQVPGYERPPIPDTTQWVALSAAGAGCFVLLVVAILWYVGRVGSAGKIRLPENESSRLMTDHVPAHLHFSNVGYSLNSQSILSGVTGSVKPGQVMAIMGASGAGKSTLLDILARKAKRGDVLGDMMVNGREVPDTAYKAVTGFVDQEDTLMGTLTVYETILYSALLRLPRDMSYDAKRFRTLETMGELGILGIKDSRIGDKGNRSISGGEKRRVSIACELVTSPSILFLDEPTSGLDAYNAFNVVESLVTLARNFKRTVVFTIHQPRSNIVAMFDQLLVLAKGRTVYSGDFSKCQDYFASIGQPCPPGFNIADFLIDLTMQSTDTDTAVNHYAISSSPTAIGDEEQGIPNSSSGSLATEHAAEQTSRPSSVASLPDSITGFVKRKSSQILEAVAASDRRATGTIPPKLAVLIDAYANSNIAAEIRQENESMRRAQEYHDGTSPHSSSELPDVVVESSELRGRKRASWFTQFRILSGRAFKNLYRDPALLAAHYASSVALALICGLFYHNVTNDIAGFQNRLGIFFFTLALFGFSSLSSLALFANERILFMRERSNGYYSTFTYFSSKILFDILPLRLIPPLVFGAIVYGLVGLVPTVGTFWKFILTLVLFNLTTASAVLWISIAFASTSVASLVGTLLMLFNLLFTGLLVNRESVPFFLQWLHTISFFHAAFEALAVNELKYLQLKEVKYGVELDLPAAVILSTFGLRSQSFWWPNISLLGIFFIVFTTSSYLTLHFFVKERR